MMGALSQRAIARMEAGVVALVDALLDRLSAIGGERLAATVALYALGEPDALPAMALTVRAEAWRPWRSYGFLLQAKAAKGDSHL
jgi:3-methyladenine DNA glycosylase/8-oxoguanine DNA glycosylase